MNCNNHKHNYKFSRRDFLTKTSLGMGALTVGSLISTSSDAYHDVALNTLNKVSFGPNNSESTFYVEDNADKLFNIEIRIW